MRACVGYTVHQKAPSFSQLLFCLFGFRFGQLALGLAHTVMSWSTSISSPLIYSSPSVGQSVHIYHLLIKEGNWPLSFSLPPSPAHILYSTIQLEVAKLVLIQLKYQPLSLSGQFHDRRQRRQHVAFAAFAANMMPVPAPAPPLTTPQQRDCLNAVNILGGFFRLLQFCTTNFASD